MAPTECCIQFINVRGWHILRFPSWPRMAWVVEWRVAQGDSVQHHWMTLTTNVKELVVKKLHVCTTICRQRSKRCSYCLLPIIAYCLLLPIATRQHRKQQARETASSTQPTPPYCLFPIQQMFEGNQEAIAYYCLFCLLLPLAYLAYCWLPIILPIADDCLLPAYCLLPITIPCPTLPHPAPPCPTLPCPTLPRPTPPHPPRCLDPSIKQHL
jgi:hypothetical protein